jgi:GNAT superfamily N-acetyltransferase
MNTRVTIRFATVDDCALLLQLIRGLAVYENAPGAVVATEDDLRRHGFGPEAKFEAILAFLDGEPVGLALFFANFSTWLGSPGMYLEDIYVIEKARGLGVGRRLMARLAAIAAERGWGRIDFATLDWNPARRFYQHLGIAPLTEWVPYRAEGEALRRLAEEDDKTRD